MKMVCFICLKHENRPPYTHVHWSVSQIFMSSMYFSCNVVQNVLHNDVMLFDNMLVF